MHGLGYELSIGCERKEIEEGNMDLPVLSDV